MNEENNGFLQNLLPNSRKWLMDDEAKVGAVVFTKTELAQLDKIVGSPAWEILKGVYTKQRLVQISVACVNAGQSAEDLQFYKGKAAEVDHFIKVIEREVKEHRKREEAESKNKTT